MTSWKDLPREEKIKAIREAYQAVGKDVSLRSISAKLSERFRETISRNAVCGFYHRCAPAFADLPLSAPGSNVPGAKRVAAPRVKPLIDTMQARKPRKKPDPVKVAEVVAIEKRDPPPGFDLPAPLGITCMELERHNCRWPTGGEKEHTEFCGHTVQEGKPYCAGHVRLSVGRGSRSEQAVDKLIRKAA